MCSLSWKSLKSQPESEFHSQFSDSMISVFFLKEEHLYELVLLIPLTDDVGLCKNNKNTGTQEVLSATLVKGHIIRFLFHERILGCGG